MQVQRPVNLKELGAWILVGAMIPMMSLFGRGIQRFVSDNLDRGTFTLIMGGMLVVAAGASLAWMARRRSKRALWHGLMLLGAILLITQTIPNATEWIHFVLFGLFGLFATRLWRPAIAVAICLLVSGGDEVLQWFLPDRVGDPRDVLMNIAACLLGASVVLTGRQTT